MEGEYVELSLGGGVAEIGRNAEPGRGAIGVGLDALADLEGRGQGARRLGLASESKDSEGVSGAVLTTCPSRDGNFGPRSGITSRGVRYHLHRPLPLGTGELGFRHGEGPLLRTGIGRTPSYDECERTEG